MSPGAGRGTVKNFRFRSYGETKRTGPQTKLPRWLTGLKPHVANRRGKNLRGLFKGKRKGVVAKADMRRGGAGERGGPFHFRGTTVGPVGTQKSTFPKKGGKRVPGRSCVQKRKKPGTRFVGRKNVHALRGESFSIKPEERHSNITEGNVRRFGSTGMAISAGRRQKKPVIQGGVRVLIQGVSKKRPRTP